MNLANPAIEAVQGESAPQLVSFWHGPLDGITYGCLATFPYNGAQLRLYAYEEIAVPPGVVLADAREICADVSLVRRYIADGKVEFSKFSNLFRYLLIEKTGDCWVDCDFVCLAPPDFHTEPMVFGYQLPHEHPGAINGAVLRLPSQHAVLQQLIEHAREVVDLDQNWGMIGPRLITPKLREAGLAELARPSAEFYPIEADEFWKPVLPEFHDTVTEAVKASKLLHLWHHMFELAGYDKELAPPKGSYLHSWLERVGAIDRFKGVYGSEEMSEQLKRWMPSSPQTLG